MASPIAAEREVTENSPPARSVGGVARSAGVVAFQFHPTRLFAACAAAALLLCSTAQAQVTLIDRQTLTATELNAPAIANHRLHLTLVRLEGTGWTRERAIGVVREAAPILAQCGVALERAELVNLSVPPRYLDFSAPAARELARAFAVSRPAIYFVRDTRSRPAFDAEAIGRGNSRTRPELADTVWITAAARDPGVALAHELAHVLMDSGEHSEEAGNLMRDETSPRDTALTVAQCARLRDTASANGLLERAK